MLCPNNVVTVSLWEVWDRGGLVSVVTWRTDKSSALSHAPESCNAPEAELELLFLFRNVSISRSN